MTIQEHIAVGSKTTMRIGGTARYYAELVTKSDAEEAMTFAKEKNVPLIMLGGGSNTVFADGEVNALVCRMKADAKVVEGDTVTVEAGKILASLINELAESDLDLSALTGIPGMLGGALFGNAGQGPKGIWIDNYVVSVTALIDGEWKTFTKEECDFRYRESMFKDLAKPVIIWSCVLRVPSKPKADVLATVETLLRKRFETQPHIKTAGSCFKALPDGTPAWQLIEKAGLRGTTVGGVQIAEKHANFLLNIGNATFKDVLDITALIRQKVPQIAGIEMRLFGNDGLLANSY